MVALLAEEGKMWEARMARVTADIRELKARHANHVQDLGLRILKLSAENDMLRTLCKASSRQRIPSTLRTASAQHVQQVQLGTSSVQPGHDSVHIPSSVSRQQTPQRVTQNRTICNSAAPSPTPPRSFPTALTACASPLRTELILPQCTLPRCSGMSSSAPSPLTQHIGRRCARLSSSLECMASSRRTLAFEPGTSRPRISSVQAVMWGHASMDRLIASFPATARQSPPATGFPPWRKGSSTSILCHTPARSL